MASKVSGEVLREGIAGVHGAAASRPAARIAVQQHLVVWLERRAAMGGGEACDCAAACQRCSALEEACSSRS